MKYAFLISTLVLLAVGCQSAPLPPVASTNNTAQVQWTPPSPISLVSSNRVWFLPTNAPDYALADQSTSWQSEPWASATATSITVTNPPTGIVTVSTLFTNGLEARIDTLENYTNPPVLIPAQIH